MVEIEALAKEGIGWEGVAKEKGYSAREARREEGGMGIVEPARCKGEGGVGRKGRRGRLCALGLRCRSGEGTESENDLDEVVEVPADEFAHGDRGGRAGEDGGGGGGRVAGSIVGEGGGRDQGARGAGRAGRGVSGVGEGRGGETHAEVVVLRVVVAVVVVVDEVVGSTHSLVDLVVGATQRDVVVVGSTQRDVVGSGSGSGSFLPEVQDA